MSQNMTFSGHYPSLPNDRSGLFLKSAALLTTLVIAVAMAMSLIRAQQMPLWFVSATAFAGFAYAMLRSMEMGSPLSATQRVLAIYVQYVCTLVLIAFCPAPSAVVFSILIASQLPWSFTTKQSALLMLAFLLMTALLQWRTAPLTNVLIETILYGCFQMFAFFAVLSSCQERKARTELAQTLAELHATQHLLSEASRQTERLTIARHLHDVLGHHLTALSIQLEIATRLTEGRAHEQVGKAQHLARLLLGEVRSVVSEIREQDHVEIGHAMRTLVAGVPGIDIQLQLSEPLLISDVAIANTLVSLVQEALTNILRHADAQHCVISLQGQEDQISLEISDDGHGKLPFTEGNGVQGMRERVAALRGELSFSVATVFPQGTRLHILLPGSGHGH